MENGATQTKVFRADSLGLLRSPTRTPEGFLRIDGYAARTGVLEYVLPDGTIQREYRPVEEVCRPDSLETLRGKPITLDHPAELLNPDNAVRFQKGSVTDGPNIEISPKSGETLLGVGTMVTDSAAIEAALTTHRELSCGYTCSLENAPGSYKGIPYDYVQRDISYNHLALVRKARGGAELSVKLDAADEKSMPTAVHCGTTEGTETMADTNILVAGKTVRVDSDAAPMLLEVAKRADAAAELQTKLDAATANLDKLRGEKDAVAAQLAKAQTDLAEAQKRVDSAVSPEAIAAAVAERAPLIELAKTHKVDGVDALDNAKLRNAIYEKATGKRADGETAGYVAGFVSALVKDRADSASTLALNSPTTKPPEQVKNDAAASDPDAARKEYEQRMAKAHVLAK